MKRLRTNCGRLAVTVLALFATILPFSSGLQAQHSPRIPGEPYCIQDDFGYLWQTAVNQMGGGEFALSGMVEIGGLQWSFSGTYQHASGQMQLEALNPLSNDCALTSGAFHYLGIRTSGSFSGNWTNDCGGFGAWSAQIRKGTCPVLRGEDPKDAQNPGPSAGEPAAGASPLASEKPRNVNELITLHELDGGFVRVVGAQELSEGLNGLELDLRDELGRKLPRGTYVLREGTSSRLVAVN